MTDAALTAELRAMRAELAALRRLVERQAAPALPAPQRALLEALAGEFAGSPFAAREMLHAARSPLAVHAPLRQALRALRVETAQQAGHALRRLADATEHTTPRLERCKSERGSGVWGIAGLDPA